MYVKALIGAFIQEKALEGAFSVITNLRMGLFEALVKTKVFVASFICHHSSTFHVSFPAVNGVTVLLFGAGKSRRFKYKVLGFDWQCTTLLVTPDTWPIELAMNLHKAFSNLMIFASLRPNFQILICEGVCRMSALSTRLFGLWVNFAKVRWQL